MNYNTLTSDNSTGSSSDPCSIHSQKINRQAAKSAKGMPQNINAFLAYLARLAVNFYCSHQGQCSIRWLSTIHPKSLLFAEIVLLSPASSAGGSGT